jgi:hypothetical protein
MTPGHLFKGDLGSGVVVIGAPDLESKYETPLCAIESPYGAPKGLTGKARAARFRRNIFYARLLVNRVIHEGHAWLASHLQYTQPRVLDDDDPGDRELGIRLGLAANERADYSLFGTDLGWSTGMRYGLAHAREHGRPTYRINLFPSYLDLEGATYEELVELAKDYGLITNQRDPRPGW